MKIITDECGVHIRLTKVEKNILRSLPRGEDLETGELTPRIGNRREVLRQMVSAACPSPIEAAAEYVAFYDETMDADHWFALTDISPLNAAMLLCQVDPSREGVVAAEITTNDETGPRDFIKLKQRLEDFAKHDPCARNLRAWLDVATTKRLKHHSWIGRYVEAVSATAKVEGLAGLESPKDETPQIRRSRLLQWFEDEVKASGKRGALARVTAREKRSKPTADRSKIGKDIRRAQSERGNAGSPFAKSGA